MKRIRVLLADDHRLVAEGIKRLLEPEFELVAGRTIGGIPEMIRPEAAGFLFRSGAVESLANVLRRVRDSSDSDLSEMGRRCRHLVETEFTAAAYRDRVLASYRELGMTPSTH